jgi:tetratricopeptide (TPR) repeat protein
MAEQPTPGGGHQGAAEKDSPVNPKIPIRQNRGTGKTPISLNQPNLAEAPAVQRILAALQPEARLLFEEGLRLMREGAYAEAWMTFQRIIQTNPGSKTVGLCYFAMGLARYLEGGVENLQTTSDLLRNFLVLTQIDTELAVFADAAQIDIAVAEIQIMHSVSDEKEAITAAEVALKALTSFLQTWPNHVQAPAARSALLEVEYYLAGRRR